MKLPIFDAHRKKAGDKEVPAQFLEEYRPDLILRAVLAQRSAQRQPYGSFPDAGFRGASWISKRRRDYKTSYGIGISRVNRKIMSRRGTRMNWVGAFSAQTKGGRRAHPPKAAAIWEQKINAKEKQKAIRSAMGATLSRELVLKRGHKVPLEYPFLIDASFESLQKTKDVEAALEQLGFAADLERTAHKKVRPGRGKMRGRRYRSKKSLLIVVGKECPLLHAAKNLPGIDIVIVKSINAHLLAPGALPGRATLWTTTAVDLIGKERLFASALA